MRVTRQNPARFQCLRSKPQEAEKRRALEGPARPGSDHKAFPVKTFYLQLAEEVQEGILNQRYKLESHTIQIVKVKKVSEDN